MTSFYKCTQLLRELLASNEDVHTVVYGDFSQADLQKKNIYPIAIVNSTASDVNTPGVIQFTYEIGALDVRDLTDDQIIDKFYSNDDEIDNLNTCHSIIARLVQQLRNTYHNDDIEIVSVSSLVPIVFSNKNILDGWSADIVLQIPNKISGC